jgi:hypothetical protein
LEDKPLKSSIADSLTLGWLEDFAKKRRDIEDPRRVKVAVPRGKQDSSGNCGRNTPWSTAFGAP